MKSFEHGKIYSVKTADLIPDPDQPRKFFCKDAHETMMISIYQYGVISPVIVTFFGEKLRIVAGERRWRAAVEAGIDTLEVKFIDQDIEAVALTENLIREDLLAMEKAEALQRLKDHHGYSQVQLSKLIGKSEATVCEMLCLNNLPDQVKDECRSNKAFVHSRLLEIAKAPDSEAMVRLFKEYKRQLGANPKGTRKAPQEPIREVMGRITGVITQLEKLQILNMDESGKYLEQKLLLLQQCVTRKLESLHTLESSDSRTFEKPLPDPSVQDGSSTAVVPSNPEEVPAHEEACGHQLPAIKGNEALPVQGDAPGPDTSLMADKRALPDYSAAMQPQDAVTAGMAQTGVIEENGNEADDGNP